MDSLLTKLRSGYIMRRTLPLYIAGLVAVTPLSICAAASKNGKQTQQGIPGIKSIALFPASNSAGFAGTLAATQLDNALKQRLESSGVYQTTTFNTRLASIQRALNIDNTLTDTDVQTPVTDPGSALRIARVMATDSYILEEVDSFSTDPKTQAVSVTISGNLYYTSTGLAARTFAVTGTAQPLSDDDTPQSVSQRAVNSASAQIITALGISSSAEKTASLPQSDSRQGRSAATALLVALGAVLVAVVLHNTGSHHSGSAGGGSSTSSTTSTVSGSTSGPPPPPSIVIR